ncbi:hypothetical protein PoB_001663000 [Plakobranchus ocellatus]|uniref:Uncharacterized protein n=1 Tax=Plakobranchus ocellatus TaxID=259542 RepID=A0AAV3Z3W6_9GAST|nr:hypothetical protein PoB_001663000 [Plakobranchus ocellatus]
MAESSPGEAGIPVRAHFVAASNNSADLVGFIKHCIRRLNEMDLLSEKYLYLRVRWLGYRHNYRHLKGYKMEQKKRIRKQCSCTGHDAKPKCQMMEPFTTSVISEFLSPIRLGIRMRSIG